MKENPIILHIELGNQSVYDWLKENQYVIFSELIRYSKKLLDENLDMVQAIMVSNLSDNIVFIIKRDNVKLTLDKAMERSRGKGTLEDLYMWYKKQCKIGTTKSEIDIQLRRANTKNLEYLLV